MAEYKIPALNKFEWQPSVLDKDLTAPPANPTKGDRYIVGVGATGAWAGHEGDIATYTTSWEFTVKKVGMACYVLDENKVYVGWTTAGTWVTIDSRIDHTNIANRGTNTHSQIDSHLAASAPHSGHEVISAKDQASGYAGIGSNGYVNKLNIYQSFQKCFFHTDFLQNAANANPPWSGTAKGGGSCIVGDSTCVDENHHGAVTLTGGITAGDGYYFVTDFTSQKIYGSEKTIFIFKAENIGANAYARMGWFDVSTANPNIADGIICYYSANGDFKGRCNGGGSFTNTSTLYTLSVSTYYRCTIVVNTNATRVDFYLYKCSDGSLVWSDYLTTNIPTSYTGHGIHAYHNGTTSSTILTVDYMNLIIDRVLVR
jgi:hypothetical protein